MTSFLPGNVKPKDIYDVIGMPAQARHKLFMHWRVHQGQKLEKKPFKNDYDILHENHRFLRSGEDEDGSWEARLARKYYDRLYKEYVICDLTEYKTGRIGFRWRTEQEVILGKGQFRCGNKHCDSKQLNSYEVNFGYVENKEKKQALVKVRVCVKCAIKLNYKFLKKARKKEKKGKGRKRTREDEEEIAVKKEEESEEEEEEGGEVELLQDDDKEENEDTLKKLSELAWKGPAEEEKTRSDEFDDYFRDMFK
eukprot:Platyproteum_vivax@DN12487_c0_g1_i1.p1